MVALAVALASPLLISGTAWSAGLERAAGALALLDQRSPGERINGKLIKTKRRAASPEQVVERALGKVFPPERVLPASEDALPSPADVLDSLVARGPPELASGDPKGPLTNGALAAFVPPTAVRGGGGSGGGGVAGPTGPGGGDPGTPGVPGTPTPHIPPAVPEPGTWATMILGMGLCAWSLRRRTSRRQGFPCAAG